MAKRLGWGLAVLLLIAGAALLVTQDRDARTTAPQPSVTPSPDLADVLSDLSDFVEQERGLGFEGEVKVVVLAGPQFDEALAAVKKPDPERTARLQTVLRVFALLAPDADLAALIQASDQRSAAFYRPAEKELVVREGEATPAVRRALVQELTHALEDQHFDLDRPLAGDQAVSAFQALVQGSSFRVAQAYEAAEQSEIDAAESPPGLEQLISFSYRFGPAFVEALVAEGGTARIDAAYAAPPVSVEQILDPQRYLSGDAPRAIKPPFAEGTVLDEGEIGPLVLRLLLEKQLSPAAAQEAATGWGGDRYVVWRSPDGRSCVRTQFAADTPEDARQLQGALADWVDRVTGQEVASAGQLLKVCEPRPRSG